MTDMELANHLFRRQGFLVCSSHSGFQIGEVTIHRELRIPIRVIAKSSHAEMQSQWNLAHEINPELAAPGLAPSYGNYYRVEAAD